MRFVVFTDAEGQKVHGALQILLLALPNKIYRRGKTADMRILAPW